MKYSFVTAALAFAGYTAAGPVKRAPLTTDGDILNYALTLEHLEDTFYREALSKFSEGDFTKAGYSKTFYENLKEISYDEKTHVSFLTTALTAAGAKPVAACTYNFGYKDVAGFLAVANVLEGVGVSAYLGAAASITNKDYLTAAGSILTVEARHSAYLRGATRQRPFPQAFDAPLSFDNVYTLAAPFFVNCPNDNAPLNLKAFPALTVAASHEKILSGSTVTVSAKVGHYGGVVYGAWVSVTGRKFVQATPSGDGSYSVKVPDGIHGQSYLLLTKDNTGATDDNVIAGPAVVEVLGTDGAPTWP